MTNKKKMANSQTCLPERPVVIEQQEFVPDYALLAEKMKSLYQADQQVAILNLHAEADSLIQQLQSLKQQRLSDHKLPNT